MDVHQKMLPIRTIEEAIAIRNQSSANNRPDLSDSYMGQLQEEVRSPDCFYRHEGADIAQECSESLYSLMKKGMV